MTAHPKPRNWNFFSKYTYYVPGVADMFILLGWLLVGAILGNLVSLVFTMALGQASTDYAMLVAYPLMFIPAMIYAGHKSQVNSMACKGVKLDNEHFSPLGALLCIPLVMFGTVAASFCSDYFTELLPEIPEFLKGMLESMTSGNLLLNFLCVSIFAPLFEEWLCRGMILRGLLNRSIKPAGAIIISAVFFAVIHANPWQAIPAFILGCLFGYVYYKTGSLKLTMLMHFTNNTMALVLSNIDSLKDMESWHDLFQGASYWIIYAACVIVVALVLLALKRIPLQSEKGDSDLVPAIFDGE